MKLYEIEREILSLIDPETGEIADYEKFEALTVERESKIENMALWYKNLTAEEEAIGAEIKRLSERQDTCKNQRQRLKEYLVRLLGGHPFKTARVACSFRSSQAVHIENETEFIRRMVDSGNYAYLKVPKPEVSKTAIADAIKQGVTVEGAELVKRSNITIK